MTMMAGSVVMSMPSAPQDVYFTTPLPHYRESPAISTSRARTVPTPDTSSSSSSARFLNPSSPRGILRVLGFYPTQGPVGSVVSVTLRLTTKPREMVFLRLVVGHTALNTTVRLNGDIWELRAVVLTDQPPKARTVSFSVQALNKTDDILDSVTFGTFTYTQSAPSPRPSIAIKRESPEELLDDRVAPGLRTAPSSSEPNPRKPARCAAGPRPPSSRAPSARPRESQRTQPLKEGAGAYAPTRGALAILTPLEAMTEDWDADEVACGRRLVRFTRAREGRTVRVSCARIAPAEYTHGDMVVSCIYRADTDSCIVTSVDIIFLLERIIGTQFDIEEKNRIRRNLEGFRPKTVSKTRVDSTDFFARIMQFAPPRPRNIEKDLKVFDWHVLPQALEKIVSRLPLAADPEMPIPMPRPLKREPSSSPSLISAPAADDGSVPPRPESRAKSPFAGSEAAAAEAAAAAADDAELFFNMADDGAFGALNPLAFLNDAHNAYAPFFHSPPDTFADPFAYALDGICPTLLSSTPSSLPDSGFGTPDPRMHDAPPAAGFGASPAFM